MFSKLRKIISIIVTACTVLAMMTFPVISVKAAEVTVNATEVTIYALDDWAKEYIAIPDEYPQSFQLTVTGAENVRYSCSNSYAQVSDTGLITPNVVTYYWYGNMGSSVPDPNREPTRITNEVWFGTSTVNIYAGSRKFEVSVTVKDYSDIYAESVMDEYLAENIEPTMTTYEKLDRIGSFIAGYEYSVYQSSAKGMIIAGGGDCWASSDAVVKMAQKLGLDAWYRNGNRDPGAGSGHMNAMVYDGSAYYEVEAGYYMPVPRLYNITERTSLFSYYYDSANGGITVYQYDGKTLPEKLEVPEMINGKTVTAIGDSFITSKYEVTEVTLPDTVCEIGESAFNSCINLQSINLPDSLQTIGNFAFTNCGSLTDIEPGGEFSVIDGAIYHDTTLVFASAVSTLTIPYGVTEIAPYAVYYNNQLSSAIIPETVTKIGEGAFGNCSNLTDLKIQGEGLKEIENFMVAFTALEELTIPASVETFGDDMMTYAYNTTLVVIEGSPAEQYAKEHNITYRLFEMLLGDVDGDSIVAVPDATAIQRKLAGQKVSVYHEQSADTDEDGKVTILDATAIQRYLARFSANPNIGKTVT